jgi:hypothetical protein
MNIKNLKNMPVVGQDPIVVAVVNAMKTFQSDLRSAQHGELSTAEQAEKATLNAQESAMQTAWSGFNVQETNEDTRRNEAIAKAESDWNAEIASILGPAVAGEADSASIIGLVNTLSEMADDGATGWYAVLQANYEAAAIAHQEYYDDMGLDTDVAALNFGQL